MTAFLDPGVEPTTTQHDLSVNVLTRIVSLFRFHHRSTAAPELARELGIPLCLSEMAQQPADETALRPFDAGPAPDDVEDDTPGASSTSRVEIVDGSPRYE